jgi:hypothetical protein
VIVDLSDPTTAVAQRFDVLAEVCDWCLRPLPVCPTIVWHFGGRTTLFLHPACSAELGRKLIRDAESAR